MTTVSLIFVFGVLILAGSTHSLSVWHDLQDEPTCQQAFDFGFEAEDSTEGMKRMIIEEVSSFRHMVRQQAATQQPTPRKEA